jgi:hypothetical protein
LILRCFFLCAFSLLLCYSCKERQPAEPSLNVAAEEELFSVFLDSLNNIKATDYERITAIRRYVAVRVDVGHSRDSLSENYYKIPWNEFSAFHCLELSGKDSLGAACGLTSYILSKLYNKAGYENYVYSCGFANTGISHEFNLVKLNDKLVVHDALMNMTINGAGGSPKDFIEVLKELKSGDTSDIRIHSENTINELWIDSVNSDFFLHFCANNTYEKQIQDITIENNRIKISLKRDFPFLTGWMVEQGKEMFKANGLPERFT